MPNDRLPLPETPFMKYMERRVQAAYTADQMHAYSDAECAPLMAELEALRQDGSKLTAENAALRGRVTQLEVTEKNLRSASNEVNKAAVSTNNELRERVRVLREVVESAAAADVFKDSPGAMDRLAEYARAALEKTS